MVLEGGKKEEENLERCLPVFTISSTSSRLGVDKIEWLKILDVFVAQRVEYKRFENYCEECLEKHQAESNDFFRRNPLIVMV